MHNWFVHKSLFKLERISCKGEIRAAGLYTILPSPIVYMYRINGEGGRWGGVYCATFVHWYCNKVGLAGGVGQYQND